MHDDLELTTLAFHGERVAARRLAQRNSVSAHAALRLVLGAAAGQRGIEALLAERRALMETERLRAVQRAAQQQQNKAKRLTRHEGPATAWQGWFDGSAHPNPGRCGIGGLLLGPSGERIEISQPAGYGNSSEAEYQALIAVLEAAVHAGVQGITIYGDSKVVIKDLTGSPDRTAPALAPWRETSLALLASVGEVSLRWVPRHKNPQADALSQRAVAAWKGDGDADPVSPPAGELPNQAA